MAGPSSAPKTEAEQQSEKGKEKATLPEENELGRWDVLARREVASKQVTVFDARSVYLIFRYWAEECS